MLLTSYNNVANMDNVHNQPTMTEKPQHRVTSSTAEMASCQRCLFSVPTDVYKSNSAAALLEFGRQLEKRDRERWNFDFRSGRPSLTETSDAVVRYEWTPVNGATPTSNSLVKRLPLSPLQTGGNTSGGIRHPAMMSSKTRAGCFREDAEKSLSTADVDQIPADKTSKSTRAIVGKTMIRVPNVSSAQKRSHKRNPASSRRPPKQAAIASSSSRSILGILHILL